jgi:hypothetical protein
MYRHRHLGFLGQTPGFNANANPVPGQQYVFNFFVTGTTGDAATDQAAIQSALATTALFANGALTMLAVTLVGTTASVTVQANGGAASVTLGGIESSLASSFNGMPLGTNFGFSLTPLDTSGLGTTTFSSQEAQVGGVVLNPVTGLKMTANWILGLPIQGPGGVVSNPLTTPSSPLNPSNVIPSIPTWVWWVLAGVGALVILDVVS